MIDFSEDAGTERSRTKEQFASQFRENSEKLRDIGLSISMIFGLSRFTFDRWEHCLYSSMIYKEFQAMQ
jgi:hypothetical protein